MDDRAEDRLGLSPRARGSPVVDCREKVTRSGSIPAGAGKPHRSTSRGSTVDLAGLSPRARGSRDPTARGGNKRGSIPAGAGKRSCRQDPGLSPRARGSPSRPPSSENRPRMVYPRGRGEAGRIRLCVRLRVYPRGRGEAAVGDGTSACFGSIPAGAGKPVVRGPALLWAAGLSPRARGSPVVLESPLRSQVLFHRGLSPRARGSPVRCRTARERSYIRVYPRGRGEATFAWKFRRSSGVYPRGRGEADVA